MNKNEAIVWLKDFIQNVDTQDNRGTAHPIQFLLQTRREYVAHDEFNNGTKTVYRHSEMESTQCETHEEAVQWLKDYGYEGEKLEKEIEAIDRFEMGHYWNTEQAFFSERGVQQHLKLNKHNLGDHRSYVIHAFRNPEIREMFEAIRALIETEKPKGE